MKKYFSTLFLATILLFNGFLANSQTNKNDLVKISLNVIGKGIPSNCKGLDSANCFFVTITILNRQDKVVKFVYDKEFGSIDNFLTNSDSIQFPPCVFGGGLPDIQEVILAPRKRVRFYANLISIKKDTITPKIKVGFRFFATGSELWNFGTTKHNNKKIEFFWSNEVLLKDNMYSYEYE